jgi:hypothetical protein
VLSARHHVVWAMASTIEIAWAVSYTGALEPFCRACGLIAFSLVFRLTMAGGRNGVSSMVDRLFIALFLLCGAAFAIGFLSLADSAFICLFLGLSLGQVFGIMCHEAGHVVCAAAGSIQVQKVWVGRGPVIARLRIGETWLELRLDVFWGGGRTVPYQPLIFQKSRAILFVLGGVIGNMTLLGLLALAALAPWSGSTASNLRWALAGAASAQMLMIVRSLIPRSLTDAGKTIENDGRLILNLLTAPPSGPSRHGLAFSTVLRRYSGERDPQMTASPAAARICFHLARTDRRTAEVGRETADALQRELERGGLAREEEMLVLDALMTDALIYRDPALLARLDAWSSRALALGPEIKTLHGSRGAALVELGHYAEAKTLLEPLIAAEAESFDRLLSCAFLARAEYALGNLDAARQLATDAHTICKASHSLWPSVTSFVDGVVVEVGASSVA